MENQSIVPKSILPAFEEGMSAAAAQRWIALTLAYLDGLYSAHPRGNRARRCDGRYFVILGYVIPSCSRYVLYLAGS